MKSLTKKMYDYFHYGLPEMIYSYYTAPKKSLKNKNIIDAMTLYIQCGDWINVKKALKKLGKRKHKPTQTVFTLALICQYPLLKDLLLRWVCKVNHWNEGLRIAIKDKNYEMARILMS